MLRKQVLNVCVLVGAGGGGGELKGHIDKVDTYHLPISRQLTK